MITVFEIFVSVVEFIMWFVDIIVVLAGKAMEMFQKIFDILQVAGDWLSDNIFDLSSLTSPGWMDTIVRPRPISPDLGLDPGSLMPNIPHHFNPVLPDNFIPF